MGAGQKLRVDVQPDCKAHIQRIQVLDQTLRTELETEEGEHLGNSKRPGYPLQFDMVKNKNALCYSRWSQAEMTLRLLAPCKFLKALWRRVESPIWTKISRCQGTRMPQVISVTHFSVPSLLHGLSMCCLQKIHFVYNKKNKLVIKGWKP